MTRAESPRSSAVALGGLGLLCLILSGLCWSLVHGLSQDELTRVDEILPRWLTVPSWYPVAPVDPDVRPHTVVAPYFASVLTVFFVVYGFAIRTALRLSSGAALGVALVVSACLQVVALASPFMLSSDVYSYVMYGRIMSVHGGNPYVDVPSSFGDDPYLPLVYAKDDPTFYGAGWTLVSAGLAHLVGDHAATAVTAFRLLAALAALGATAVCALGLRTVAAARAAGGVVFLGWNPLWVMESGLSGHNDAVMALLIALSIWLLSRRSYTLAIAALAVAILVKASAVLILPVVGWFALRQIPTFGARRLFIVRVTVISGTLAVVATWPLVPGSGNAFQAYGASAQRYTNSLTQIALIQARIWLGEPRDDALAPLRFVPLWARARSESPLVESRDAADSSLTTIPSGAALLVIAPRERRWTRVFDPGSGQNGYARSGSVERVAARPAEVGFDPKLLAAEQGSAQNPTLRIANLIVRLASTTVFGLVYCALLIPRMSSTQAFSERATIVLLCALYLIAAWFFPWYITWPLVTATLAIGFSASVWTGLLSWSGSLLYATTGYFESPTWESYLVRSVVTFALPPLALGCWVLARNLLRGIGAPLAADHGGR